MLSLDGLDASILGRVTRHGRIGIAEISTQLGVARNTVQARLTRLEHGGVIQRYTVQVDLAAAGVAVQAFVSLELNQRRLAAVIEALAALPEVLEANTQAGREDLLVRVGARTHSELQEVVTRIIEIDGVRHTTTTMIVSTPIPLRTQPILELITSEAGFGRSTPRLV